MKYLLLLLAVLLNIGVASAQIEVTDSASTEWGGGTNVDVTPDKPTGRVTSISLSQKRLLLSGGETAQLVAKVNADAENKSVKWSVADNAIATVSVNGLVTAITAGQTVVTATSVDGGLTAQCLVTVRNNAKVYVERITLDITEMEMYVGDVKAVIPTVYPENATDKTLKWETRGAEYYNPALPDENHIFTAYKPGVMEIKLYPNDGSEAYAVCKITVKDRPLTKMSLPSEITLGINEMMTLKPEVSPEPFQRKYKWKVADPSVAYISSSGRIIGVKAGITTVTATALDGTGISATSKVTVTSNVASMGYSGWILERGEDIHPWTARCFHEAGYYEKSAPNDSRGNKWYSPDYDDSSWGLAYGPLKHRVWSGGDERRTGYGQWELLDYSTMSIRQKFYLPDVSGYDFRVYARVYSSGEVYINGHRVYITDTGDWNRNGSFMAFIDPSYLVLGGENTIAIIGYPSGEEQYLDFGIHYDTMIPVTRVIIKQKELTLDIGATEKLEAVVKPAEASHPEVRWESLQPAIASVDQNGNVMGRGEGSATITATSVDGTGIVASCEVTVTDKIVPVKVGEWIVAYDEPWTAQVLYATEADMLYRQEPAADGKGRNWTSVDYDDLSWTTITGPMYKNNGFFPNDNCRYYVRSRFFVGDLSELNSLRLCIHHDDEATVYINGIVVADYPWCSDDECVLPLGIFRNGENVIAVNVHQGSGDAYLNFGLKGSSEYAEEIVKAESIAFEHQEETVDVGKRLLLPVIFSPENTTFRNLEWTSSNESVATVSSDGYVKGEAVGEAVITATTMDGSDLSASCRIHVVPSNTILDWGANTPWASKYVYAAEAYQYDYNDPQPDAKGRKWTALDYDDSEWGTLTGPMGMDIWYAPYNYTWSGEYNRHWLRRTFHLNENPEGKKFRFECMHDDDIQVYLNGELVVDDEGCTDAAHVQFEIPGSAFREGENILAIRFYQGWGGAYLDYEIARTTVSTGWEECQAITSTPAAVCHDLTGRKVREPQRGIFISSDGKKLIVR